MYTYIYITIFKFEKLSVQNVWPDEIVIDDGPALTEFWRQGL